MAAPVLAVVLVATVLGVASPVVRVLLRGLGALRRSGVLRRAGPLGRVLAQLLLRLLALLVRRGLLGSKYGIQTLQKYEVTPK